jgi:branched-chain amino acid transport system permease protein
MLVIGGTGSVAGALIGATLILLTPQLLQPLARWWQFTYGFVVIASVIVGRRGLSGIGSEAVQLVVRRFVPPRNQDAVGRTTTDGWEYYPIHRDSETGLPRALRVRQVTKTFGGVTALKNVDVELQPGVVHAIIGPNGSGKSTLVNVITGLLAPSSGGVSFGAGDLTSKSPDYISRLGVVRTFQTPRLFLQVSVMDNVLPMAELAGYRGRAARIRALQCLAMVGLKQDAQQSAKDLPQGHRRLLEIARALALGPKVFLLDEPAAGLAEAEWNELKSLLRKLAEEGMSVAVIEHNMPFVLAVADKITVLQLGRVLAEGSPAEIQTNPIVRSAYMGNVVETAV